ncbi:MAG: hypothetical protein NC398_03235 [Acetatifactor muris]|nr:hypothetical protein [Acetatifactor muris]MCM1525825.1 hypothetical protein [Bacteroides sp.]
MAMLFSLQKSVNALSKTSMQEVNVIHPMAKRTAKNSIFLDLFKDKKYLLALYKTLHPEDTQATENSLTDVTIENENSMCPFDSQGLLK